jgi:GNAT superfamily N-acetyltransferase
VSIAIARTDEEILGCYPVMKQLRTGLGEAEFLERVRRQSSDFGYALAFLEDEGRVRSVAGFRISECLFAGKYLYVDDLVTDAGQRSRGHGDRLFDWLVAQARENDCTRLRLDSGVERTDAHRFYLRKGMKISSHHFSLDLQGGP